MKKTIRTVGIFGKNRDPSVGGHASQLRQYLQGRGLNVLIEESIAKLLTPAAAPGCPLETIGREIDLAVVIGGDGTMLRAARHLAPHGVPIVGVNLGRVGFLADIQIDDMINDVGQILDAHSEVAKRLLLRAEIVRSGKVIHEAHALNDVVVTKGELARLIEFETWLDGEFVSSARGDGLIIASPTGSTAYALSAGGPILHPDLPAIALVPICPHTLSQRPLVVSGNSLVEVVMTGAAPGQHAHVSFDGQTSLTLEDNDRVRVRQADLPLELMHPTGHSYFDVLRKKMHWGRKL